MRVIESTKNKLQVEVPAVHTVANLVSNELWKDKSVKESAYMVDHPQVGKPRLLVNTDGKEPITAVRDACKRIKKMNAELLKSFA